MYVVYVVLISIGLALETLADFEVLAIEGSLSHFEFQALFALTGILVVLGQINNKLK